MRRWDILIPTIPQRHEKLCELLAELGRQWMLGLGVRVLRTQPHTNALDSHIKRTQLLELSSAEYVSFVDDDDMIASDYVSAIMAALSRRPDYVGFYVDVTWNGEPHRKAKHSLDHTEWSGWDVEDKVLIRDITHLNPMRRSLALLVDWEGRTDEQWSQALRETGQVREQVMIPRDMYFYRFDQHNNFSTPHGPAPEPWPQLPSYHWLTAL